MANNVTPEYLRGFLVPLNVGPNNIWSAQSTFTTAQQRAGTPTAAQNTPMQIVAKGQQTDPSSITIKTQKSGFAGHGASFIYKDNQTNVQYGRDPQNSLNRFDNLKFSSSALIKYEYPSQLDTGIGQLLVSYQKTQSPSRMVKVSKLLVDGTSTEHSVYTESATITGYNLLSDMCILSDGSYFLCHLVGDSTAVNIRTYSSTDGQTWTIRSRRSLENQISIGTATGGGASFQNYNIQKIRVAQTGGVILLLIETIWNDTGATKRNRVLQYVSTDQGGNFTLLTTDALVDDHSFHSIDLYAYNNKFRIAFYFEKKASYMTLPSAFTSMHVLATAGAITAVSTAFTNGTNDFMTDGMLSAFTDEGASHHIIARIATSDGEYRIFWSEDTLTWRQMGIDTNGRGRAIRTDTSGILLGHMMARTWTGRTIITFMPVGPTTNYSIGMLFMGGYRSFTLPPAVFPNSAIAEWNRSGFGINLVGYEKYSNYANVTRTHFSGGEALNSGGVFIQNQEFYTISPTTSGMPTADIISKGILVHARIEAMTGGNTATTTRGINLKIDDTVADYEVELRVTPSNILVRDINGSSDVLSVGSLSLNTIEIVMQLSNAQVTVFYCDADTETNSKNFIDLGTASSLTDGGGGASNLHRVKFGHFQTTGGTFETTWSSLSIAQAFNIGETIHGFSNPDDLMGRAYPMINKFAYVADDVQISTSDGQTYEANEYTIVPDSNYSINNIFYSVAPTPRHIYKSLSVASGNVPEQFIAIKLNSDVSVHVDESLPNDIVGLHISNYNFRNAKLEYYSSGTWTVLDTFDTAINTKCVVQGRTLRGHSSASNQPYFKYNECAGWRVRVQTEGDVFVWRKIVSNSEGVFGKTATTNKQAVLELDENVSTSGIATSDLQLIPNSMTLLVNLHGRRLEALGLRIPAQTTYENYIQIGLLHVGSVLIPGKQYQRGRTISINGGTDSTETQSGVMYSRNTKPSRRTFRIAWTEGIDITDLQSTNPDPDYWIANVASGEPVAIANDVSDLLQGLLDYTQGQQRPIVYLPLIKHAVTERELLRESEQALVMIQGDVQVENILGDELVNVSGELMRVATMVLVEVK